MKQRALELVSFGWRVIPLHGVIRDREGRAWCTCSKPQHCPSPAKHPRTPHGLKNASVDERWIEAWWRKWPAANVGVATGAQSGLVVLDVDAAHGGEDSLDELLSEHGKLPETAEVLTGGGGRHIYFRHPGSEIRNSAGKLGSGLDVRGDGGYVVGPGSAHISGRTYDWEASSDPEQVGVAPMPRWLIERCARKSDSSGCSVTLTEGVVQEGGRNAWLTSLAGSLRRRGVGELAIARALWCINSQHCTPALDVAEVRAIAHSVIRYAPAEHR